MIPVELSLSGFLSYREPATIDFRPFDMACISGHNGAGKSSLLDAITWAIFGEARRRGEALLNSGSETAKVAFIFEYEGNTYRVERILSRGKTTQLEFQIRDGQKWRPLTEKSLKLTEDRIRSVLRLDYETFVNASFFLQGKADQFTQQKAADRKRILSAILGLEQWETYRQRAAEQRKNLESDLKVTENELRRLQEELDEEPARKTRLNELETRLKDKEITRQSLQRQVEDAKKREAALTKQRELVKSLSEMLNAARRSWQQAQTRAQAQRQRQAELTDQLQQAPTIQAAFNAWNDSRSALENWARLEGEHHRLERQLAPLRSSLNSAQARLEEEQRSLRGQERRAAEQAESLPTLQAELEKLNAEMENARQKANQREALRQQQEDYRRERATLEQENKTLRDQMSPIDTRIKNLTENPQGVCPLCGQDLSETHRAETIAQLEAEGKTLGDRFRANKERITSLQELLKQIEAGLQPLQQAESEQERLTARRSRQEERLQTARQALADWQAQGAPRLQQVTSLLQSQTFETEIRSQIADLEKQQQALGYNAAAHQEARQTEQAGRDSQEKRVEMEKARAELQNVEKSLQEAESTAQEADLQVQKSETAYAEAAAQLTADESGGPNLEEVETAYLRAQEAENTLRQEVGSARQQVNVLERIRAQKAEQTQRREEQALAIERFKKLERAFGKDGVPALMIEQALPQIEESANRLLSRLSGGTMNVRFITQEGYKTKRDDLKETLEIRISDPAGEREYELFSGGEAFRVNFAIRLALSEVLARRSGARLQTLVIDEGFGSQDAQGVQRLIEAINAVRNDFAKILVITHLEELKDAFPNRIDIEKTPQGSRVRVL